VKENCAGILKQLQVQLLNLSMIQQQQADNIKIQQQNATSLIHKQLSVIQTQLSEKLNQTWSVNDKVSTSMRPTGRNCADILKQNPLSESGVYNISILSGGSLFQVYCDMQTDGGGWTVIQRRLDGSEIFYRPWTDYVTGFGHSTGEFWIGNDRLASLTTAQQNQLRVDLKDWSDNYRYAQYSQFKIAPAGDKYQLKSVGTYSGNAGDSLTVQLNMKFTTYDQDNDPWAGGNCASSYRGAWWHRECHLSNLNGEYNDTTFGQGINWQTWLGHTYSLKFTEMKIRPVEL